MRTLAARFRENAFLRHNAVFFAGSLAVAFLNYVYHPVLSRLLPLAAFGEVQAIFALTLEITLVLNVLGVVAVALEANREEAPERAELVGDLQAVTLYLVLVASLVTVAFGSWLAHALQFSSSTPFLFLAGILLTSLPITFRRSYLQAGYDFTAVSLANILMALGRLVFAVALIALGTGVLGALGGLLASQVLALGYLWAKTRHVPSLRLTLRARTSRALASELAFTAATLVATLFVAFAATGDVVFAKIYLDPTTAGAYSGISTVARIIFFATSSVAAVLLPFVKIGDRPDAQRAAFLRSLALVVLVGGGALVVFSLASRLFISLLVGGRFAGLAGLLPRLALVSLLASIANLFVSYFTALRRPRVLLASSAGFAATIVPILRFHEAPGALVNGFLIGAACSVAIFTFYFMKPSIESAGADHHHHRARL